eukprot:COSAG01_NODE_1805_length_9192_cov_13.807324_9_plen_101_part_00
MVFRSGHHPLLIPSDFHTQLQGRVPSKIPRVRSFLDPMMRPAVRFLCAALLLCGASANKTVTWLDKRAKLIGDVYGKGVRPNRSGSWFGCMPLPSCGARL